MKGISFLLATAAAVAGVVVSSVRGSGHADEQAAPIYGIKIPTGYRDWRLISVAHEAGNLNDFRAVLGNDVAITAYRRDKLPFPDGAIIARLAWNYVPSEENNRVFGRCSRLCLHPVRTYTLIRWRPHSTNLTIDSGERIGGKNMANLKSEIRSNDMKFEIVVIPVPDVDRAKEFYGRLEWRLDADFDNSTDFRVIQFTPPGSGCTVIFGKNVNTAAPGSAQGLYLIVSDIAAARDELLVAASRSVRCSITPAAYTQARTGPTCLGGAGSAVRIPNIAATARSPRSVIRTATAGCFRRSRRGCPAVSPATLRTLR
jgi:predicted enzyme related to lactoylglutathione lyase